MYLRRGNPYNPGYAIGKNTLSEGPRARVSKPLPRHAGEAAHVQVSPGLPRRTNFFLQPSPLVEGKDALGDLYYDDIVGSSIDPIANYGKRAAATIFTAASKVPPAQRAALVREALDKIDKGLYEKVAFTACKLKTLKGYDAKEALRRALQIQFAEKLLSTYKKAGTGEVPKSALGACCANCSDEGLGALVYEGGRWVDTSGTTTTRVVESDPTKPTTSAAPLTSASLDQITRTWKSIVPVLPAEEKSAYDKAVLRGGPGCTNSFGGGLFACILNVKSGNLPYKVTSKTQRYYNDKTKELRVIPNVSMATQIGNMAGALAGALKTGACKVAGSATVSTVAGIAGGGIAAAGVGVVGASCGGGRGTATEPPPQSSGFSLSPTILVAGAAALGLLVFALRK